MVKDLLITLNNIDSKILWSIDSFLTKSLLYSSNIFNTEMNTFVLNTTTDYILPTEISEEPLFEKKTLFLKCNSLIHSEFPLVY